MPDAVPNYLTVDPVTGAVGANFSGHVHAAGVDLDSDPSGNFQPEHQVRWVRASDGTITGWVGSDGNIGGFSEILVNTPDPAGGPNRSWLSVSESFGGGGNVRAVSDGQSAYIIVSNGTSDFVQLPGVLQTVLSAGAVTGSTGAIIGVSTNDFSVVRTSAGRYTVTFLNPLSQRLLIGNLLGGAVGFFIVNIINSSTVSIGTDNTSGVATDISWEFLSVGIA